MAFDGSLYLGSRIRLVHHGQHLFGGAPLYTGSMSIDQPNFCNWETLNHSPLSVFWHGATNKRIFIIYCQRRLENRNRQMDEKRQLLFGFSFAYQNSIQHVSLRNDAHRHHGGCVSDFINPEKVELGNSIFPQETPKYLPVYVIQGHFLDHAIQCVTALYVQRLLEGHQGRMLLLVLCLTESVDKTSKLTLKSFTVSQSLQKVRASVWVRFRRLIKDGFKNRQSTLKSLSEMLSTNLPWLSTAIPGTLARTISLKALYALSFWWDR